MNALLDSICKAGSTAPAFTTPLPMSTHTTASPGHMMFDPNQKNVGHMYLGTVHNGAISYRPAGNGEALAVRHGRPGFIRPGMDRRQHSLFAGWGGSVEYAGPHRANSDRDMS